MSNLVAAGLASYQAPGFEGQVAGELSVAQPAAEGAMEEGHGKEAHQLAAAEGEAKETSEEEEGEEEQQHAEPKQQAENLMQPQQAMPYPGLWSFPFAGMNGQPPPQAYPYAMQHPYSGYWPFPHGMHPGTLGQPIGKNDKTGKRRRKKKPAMEVRAPLHLSFSRFEFWQCTPLRLASPRCNGDSLQRTKTRACADKSPAVPAAPAHSQPVSASPCWLFFSWRREPSVLLPPAPQTALKTAGTPTKSCSDSHSRPHLPHRTSSHPSLGPNPGRQRPFDSLQGAGEICPEGSNSVC